MNNFVRLIALLSGMENRHEEDANQEAAKMWSEWYGEPLTAEDGREIRESLHRYFLFLYKHRRDNGNAAGNDGVGQ